MNNKTWGYALLAAGIILVVVSAFADALGLGAAPVFGYKQIIGVVVGVLAAGAGAYLAFLKK